MSDDKPKLLDIHAIDDDEMRKLNARPWDGKRIESPFYAGDYLMPVKEPDLTMGEVEALQDMPIWNPATVATRKATGEAFFAIFADWQLTGRGGKPIQKPYREVKGEDGKPVRVANWPAYQALSKRYFWWVICRAFRIVDDNPLA